MTGSFRIAVVQGGPSAEAEVSRVSAGAVAAALAADGHDVTRFELDSVLAGALLAHAPDVVFPVCHGAVGEDGSLQGLLEVLGLPYVGSGVLASALAMDKPSARVHFAARGLPLAEARLARDPAEAGAILAALGPRLVVKPAAGGSALGVSRLALGEDPGPLAAALEAALAHGACALVERFVVGDEVTCGVLEEAGGPRALPPTRIATPEAEFYDFESRYAAGKSVHECPAPYSAALLAEIQRIAVAAHCALGCRDLSRVDFVVSSEVTLLEVNTLPGFTPTSLYPEAAAAQGTSFVALCRQLVEAAVRRGVPQRVAAARFPGSAH